jgi:hypothetical protein
MNRAQGYVKNMTERLDAISRVPVSAKSSQQIRRRTFYQWVLQNVSLLMGNAMFRDIGDHN